MNKVHGLFLVVIFSLAYTQLVKCQSKPSCQTKCGNVSIEYPFGISQDCCYAGHSTFLLTCNETTNKLFTGNLQVINISHTGELRILESIAYSCYNSTDLTDRIVYNTTLVDFTLSNKNSFTAVGCNTYAVMTTTIGDRSYSTGCLSLCDSTTKEDGLCSGEGCCRTSVSKGSQRFVIRSSRFDSSAYVNNSNNCSYAFLVEEGMFSFFPSQDLKNLRNVTEFPVVLDWSIGNQTCEQAGNTSICGQNSVCTNSTTRAGYNCKCKDGYDGNPYLAEGCQGMAHQFPKRILQEGAETQMDKINNTCRRTLLKAVKVALKDEYEEVLKDPVFGPLLAIIENNLIYSGKIIHSFMCKQLRVSKLHSP